MIERVKYEASPAFVFVVLCLHKDDLGINFGG